MGYRSDVRIITTKKGYNKLEKFVKSYMKKIPEQEDFNLLDNCNFKEENKFSVYLGWNNIKWYEESYESVMAIMEGLDYLKNNNMSYRYSRIGENYDDYDEHSFESYIESEQDLEYPSVIREFDDEYVIRNINISKDKLEI